MDKFLIRTPREQPSTSNKTVHKTFRQATLESLKGVVVIEKIEKQKKLLELADQTPHVLLRELQMLKAKRPAREVLKRTGIGKTVHKLCKSSDDRVASLARQIYNEWKAHVMKSIEPKELLPVREDLKSRELQNLAYKWLAKGLSLEEDDDLVKQLEIEVRKQTGKLLNSNYRRTIRTMYLNLKGNEEIRNSLKNGEISLKNFVTKTVNKS